MNQFLYDPTKSIFVSASAGTGKTKLLIDRLLTLLFNNVAPSKILCLTFSKTAAAEINHRLIKEIANLALLETNELLNILERFQLTNIDQQKINQIRNLFTELVFNNNVIKVQTIHSFAQNLLQRFSLEAGLKSNFQICDDNERNVYFAKIQQELFDLAKSDTNLANALNYLAWHVKDFTLNNLIKEIIQAKSKFFELKDHVNLSQDDNRKIFSDQVILTEQLLIEDFIKNINIEHNLVQELLYGSVSDQARCNALIDFTKLSFKQKILNYHSYSKIFLTLEQKPLKNLFSKKITNLETISFLLNEQERVIKFVVELNRIKKTNLGLAFNILANFTVNCYNRFLLQNNLIDYHDLIKKTAYLLTCSESAEWIKFILFEEIDHILVDEAQDNSLAQWQIINILANEFLGLANKSIFFVGDTKQSIFGFQGADPRIFQQMEESLPLDIAKIELKKSYRSSKEILKLVDHIFNQEAIKEQMKISPKNLEHQTVIEKPGTVEIWPLEQIKNQQQQDSWSLKITNNDSKFQVRKLLADKIAQFIHDKISAGFKAGDFLILLRRRSELQQLIIKSLFKLQVPVSGLDRFYLREHPAIKELYCLSRFILCPYDEFNLAILLKSAFFMLSDQQLIDLCVNREENLWTKLQELPELAKELSDIIRQAQDKALFEFFFDLIEYQGIRKKLFDYFAEDTNLVLDNFLYLLKNFTKTNPASLELFINYLENSDYQLKIDVMSEVSKVKIMTVHAAKGLQAPFVIIADTNDAYFSSDAINFNIDHEILVKNKFNKADLEQEQEHNKDLAQGEYLRLLYVALTRAQYHLLICGISNKDQPNLGSWYQLIQNSFLQLDL